MPDIMEQQEAEKAYNKLRDELRREDIKIPSLEGLKEEQKQALFKKGREIQRARDDRLKKVREWLIPRQAEIAVIEKTTKEMESKAYDNGKRRPSPAEREALTLHYGSAKIKMNTTQAEIATIKSLISEDEKKIQKLVKEAKKLAPQNKLKEMINFLKHSPKSVGSAFKNVYSALARNMTPNKGPSRQ